MSYKPEYKYIPPINWQWLTPLYDFFCSMSGLGQGFKERVLDSIPLHDGQTVVDIACGTGVFLAVAKRKYPGIKFIGVDPDARALSIARARLRRAGLSVELKEAFAESLPLPDESVDACFSTLAFHHLPDHIKKQAVREIYRVLKPGGTAVITDFGKSDNPFRPKWMLFEKFEYLAGNLKGLVLESLREAGFDPVRIPWKRSGVLLPRIDVVIGEKKMIKIIQLLKS